MLPEGYETDVVFQLETNLDDSTPEILGHVSALLLEQGALDVWFTPIHMKKNRPAVQLSVLCEPRILSSLTDLLFRETSAFGLRVSEITRLKLRRDFIEVSTAYGPITLKRGFRGSELLQVSPEFESCRAAAQRTHTPLHTVYEAARQAAAHLIPPG